VAYLDFRETGKALEEFRRVADLAPQNPIGYNNIGSAYFARGEWEQGIPAYERSLKLEPHWLTYSSLGTAYFYLKRYDEAVKEFEQAATLNPNDAVTIGNLADGLRWSGQQDRARATYARAIGLAYKELQVNPRDATVLAMVALYHAKSGRDDRASDLMKQARTIDPASPALLYYAAVVDTLGGRHQAALALLEKALAGGYSAREAAEDPELQPLHAYDAFNRAVRRYSTPTT
jgi:tetratricopeptide (TPR) repeat protein